LSKIFHPLFLGLDFCNTLIDIGCDELFGDYRKESYSAPVNVGEEYKVKIEDLGRDGDGIARVEGFVIFVPGAKVGDEVKIRISATRRKFAFAELVEE